MSGLHPRLAECDPLTRMARIFGGQVFLSRVLGVNKNAVSKWKITRRIPHARQRQIVELSAGCVLAEEFPLWQAGEGDTYKKAKRRRGK